MSQTSHIPTTRYTATVKHHSIAYARTIEAGATLHAAKCAATTEFGQGHNGHLLVIHDRDATHGLEYCASKCLGRDVSWHTW